MTDLFTDIERPPDVILLDYVRTLVSNTAERHKYWQRGQDYRHWIAMEQYRLWLVGRRSS